MKGPVIFIGLFFVSSVVESGLQLKRKLGLVLSGRKTRQHSEYYAL